MNKYTFSNLDKYSQERSSYFRDLVGGFYNIVITNERPEGFQSEETIWTLGDVSVFHARQDSYFKARDGFSTDRVPERITISYCRRSRGVELENEIEISRNPLDVVINHNLSPLSWFAFDQTDERAVVMPADSVGFDRDRLRGSSVFRADSPNARGLRMQIDLIVEAVYSGDEPLVQILLEGFSEILRSMLGATPPDQDHLGVQEMKLRMILRYIEDSLEQSRLTPPHLCKTFAMSRPSLYRLFNDSGGISEHIRRRRLERAYRRILEMPGQETNLTALAGTLGFHDSAHFSRRFKEQFGFAPSQLLQVGEVLCAHASVPVRPPEKRGDVSEFIDLVFHSAGNG